MDGMRFVVGFHFHGTMSADGIMRYILPCDATLVRVDTCGTADVHSSLIVGTAADDNGYITAFTPGHNATWVTKDRGDFDGALVTDTNECPHIAKNTEMLLTLTHASASHVDIFLTFLEG